MDKFERVFELHKLLLARRSSGVSFAELQERLDCERATLRRTLTFLRDTLHAPLIHDAERGGYLYEGESIYAIPGLWFTAEELSALLILDELIERQPFGLLSDVLKPFRARIESLAQKAGIGLPQWRSRLRLLRMAARPAGSQFGIIAEAIARRRRLHIHYHGRSDDRMAPRIVSPQRLTLYRDNWYVDAWCHARDALRVFAIDRVIAAELIEEPSDDVPTAALDATLATSYGIFAGTPTETAVLRFSPHAARWVKAETWHPQQQDQLDEDGTLTRDLPYHRSDELVMDILRHGADVEVLSPASLRADVAARLRKALVAYNASDKQMTADIDSDSAEPARKHGIRKSGSSR